jgi:serine/threonine-protein kinase
LRKFQWPLEGLAYPAISPDGKMVAFIKDKRLWIRDMDRLQAREIPDTDGAYSPFWSPENDYVGYFQGATLRRAPVQGGPSAVLGHLPGISAGGFGATWGVKGTIFASLADQEGLMAVPAQGGEVKSVLRPDSSRGEQDFHHPHMLPGDRGLLLAVHARGENTVYIAVVVDGVRTRLLHHAGERLEYPVYAPSGHILYQRGQAGTVSLWAAPFSLNTLEVTGESYPVVESGGFPSVSSEGTLVYGFSSGAGLGQLAWVDRSGRVSGSIGRPQQQMDSPALSPDGRFVAFSAFSQGNEDIWVYDLARETATRLTFDPERDTWPVWSPDGRLVAFSSDRSGGGDLYVKAADGRGSETLLVGEPGSDIPMSWSQDGRHLIYQNTLGSTGWDLWRVSLQVDRDGMRAEGAPQPFLRTPFIEVRGRLSPDGRYLAHQSTESGRSEVYVRPFPSGEGKWQVSSEGGGSPRWSPKGDMLYYVADGSVSGNGPLMAASVEMVKGFRTGRPVKVFDLPSGVDLSEFDVFPDGQRFLTVQAVGDPQTLITVVENWAREFMGRK